MPRFQESDWQGTRTRQNESPDNHTNRLWTPTITSNWSRSFFHATYAEGPPPPPPLLTQGLHGRPASESSGNTRCSKYASLQHAPFTDLALFLPTPLQMEKRPTFLPTKRQTHWSRGDTLATTNDAVISSVPISRRSCWCLPAKRSPSLSPLKERETEARDTEGWGWGECRGSLCVSQSRAGSFAGAAAAAVTIKCITKTTIDHYSPPSPPPKTSVTSAVQGSQGWLTLA